METEAIGFDVTIPVDQIAVDEAAEAGSDKNHDGIGAPVRRRRGAYLGNQDTPSWVAPVSNQQRASDVNTEALKQMVICSNGRCDRRSMVM